MCPNSENSEGSGGEARQAELATGAVGGGVNIEAPQRLSCRVASKGGRLLGGGDGQCGGECCATSQLPTGRRVFQHRLLTQSASPNTGSYNSLPPNHTRFTMDVSLALYRSVFPEDKKFPFSKDRISKITRNRSLLDGVLFFDLLLSQIAHIDDGNNVPQSDASLTIIINFLTLFSPQYHGYTPPRT